MTRHAKLAVLALSTGLLVLSLLAGEWWAHGQGTLPPPGTIPPAGGTPEPRHMLYLPILVDGVSNGR